MTQLTVAVVVVKVVGKVHTCRNGIAPYYKCLPVIVKTCDGTTSFVLRFRKTHFATSHRNTRGDGNAPLLVVIDSTVEMIDDAIVFHHIALMGKHLVVRL